MDLKEKQKIRDEIITKLDIIYKHPITATITKDSFRPLLERVSILVAQLAEEEKPINQFAAIYNLIVGTTISHFDAEKLKELISQATEPYAAK